MKNLILGLICALTGCLAEEAENAAKGGCGQCEFESDFDGCDGTDNDCDCEVDEDCPTRNEPQTPEPVPPTEGEAEAEAESESEPEPEDALPCLLEDEEHGNVSDGQDNDCDGTADEWGPSDSDGDMVPDATDCDPANPLRWTGAPETCDDGVDSDCDGGDSTSSDGCYAAVGAIDGLAADGRVRIAIAGNILDGLETEPLGTINRVSIASDAAGWSDETDGEWTYWLGNGALHVIRDIPEREYNRSNTFRPRLRAENVSDFDLHKWNLTGILRRVPARTGRGGLVLIAP